MGGFKQYVVKTRTLAKDRLLICVIHDHMLSPTHSFLLNLAEQSCVRFKGYILRVIMFPGVIADKLQSQGETSKTICILSLDQAAYQHE